MARFFISGGKQLSGAIRLAGSKSAVTKMMVASLLTDEPCHLENYPLIGDAEITIELCRQVGSVVNLDIDNRRLLMHTPAITNSRVVSLSRRNRIPILALGPLLHRTGEAEVPVLGGDRIGPRPVDMHLAALTAMGAVIENSPQSYRATAPHGLHGAKISLLYPSVGATENTVLAAVLAQGRTVISNAAIEPEVIELIQMLQKMGAIIELGAHRTIYIDGVRRLRGATHYVMPDRNEAISFACLAVATSGKILVQKARQRDLVTFLNALRRIGGEYEVIPEGIVFYRANQRLQATEIETDTHPGFMTDWQQPFAALLTQAQGSSVIHETVHEDRFGYVNDLNLMGADITVFTKCLGELPCRFGGLSHHHSAIINGPMPLRAAALEVRDLRAGMVNVIAALIAQGESVISGVEEIDRGYYDLDGRLRGLGAEIRRV